MDKWTLLLGPAGFWGTRVCLEGWKTPRWRSSSEPQHHRGSEGAGSAQRAPGPRLLPVCGPAGAGCGQGCRGADAGEEAGQSQHGLRAPCLLVLRSALARGGRAGAGDRWLLDGSYLHAFSFLLWDGCDWCVCMHRPAAGSSKCPGHLLILQRPSGWARDLLLLGQVPCGERCQPGRAQYLSCTCCPAFLPGCLLRCLARGCSLHVA